MTPKLLDLFCGLGGASMGYSRAGFDVVGVDLKPQPHYPFEFVQADALELLSVLIDGRAYESDLNLGSFAAIHASPPCQRFSQLMIRWGDERRDEHPDLVEPTRLLLRATRLPYIIENVPQAPLLDPVVLCGSMFGLGARDDDGNFRQLRRHRLFESNLPLEDGGPCRHTGQAVGVYGHGRWDNSTSKHRGGYQGNVRECREAMGIEWGTRDGIAQAIPPAYAEFLGRQLLRHITVAAARGERVLA